MKHWLAGLCFLGCAEPSRTVVVTALAGSEPEAGLAAISHAPDGTVIDQTVTDTAGEATLVARGDSFISLVFPAVIGPGSTVRVVTTLAPAESLSVHSAVPSAASQAIVGTLTIEGPPIAGADSINIDLGCTRVSVATLPATIDVPACSLGTDTQLDVLVRATHVAGELSAELDGYAAARVSFANGTARFAIPSWTTAMVVAPVDVVGPVSSVGITTFADGLQFDTRGIEDQLWLWNGLAIDMTQVTATLSDAPFVRTTTRAMAGLPQSLTYAESDFLPRVTPRTTLDTLNPLSFSWRPEAVGDAFVLSALWENDAVGPRTTVIWTAYLSPASEDVTFPMVDGALAAATSRSEISSRNVSAGYIDSDIHDGFEALIRDGLDLRNAYSTPVELMSAPVHSTLVPGCECSTPR